jgi:hypothetical protein
MTLLQQAQEADDKTQRGFRGWMTIIGFNLPTALWTWLMYWAFQHTRVEMLPQLPPDTVDKAIFYGLTIGVFEIGWSMTGYGVLSIPLAALLFVLVTFVV